MELQLQKTAGWSYKCRRPQDGATTAEDRRMELQLQKTAGWSYNCRRCRRTELPLQKTAGRSYNSRRPQDGATTAEGRRTELPLQEGGSYHCRRPHNVYCTQKTTEQSFHCRIELSPQKTAVHPAVFCNGSSTVLVIPMYGLVHKLCVCKTDTHPSTIKI